MQKSEKFLFCGAIVRKQNKSLKTKLRKKYGITKGKFTVVASFGGGGSKWHKTILRKYFTAIRIAATKIQNLSAITITGPNYKKTNGFGKTEMFEPYLLELMSVANLVVTHAGYNSVNELLAAKTPGIIIPRPVDKHPEN